MTLIIKAVGACLLSISAAFTVAAIVFPLVQRADFGGNYLQGVWMAACAIALAEVGQALIRYDR